MSPYTPFFASEEQDELLYQIERLASSDTVGVFDLDGCLFDPRYRQLAICREYAELTPHKALYQISASDFWDWDLSATLRRAGLTQAWLDENFKSFSEFWWGRFFNSEHVAFDRIMPGVSSLIRDLHQRGMTIVYLTGRHHGQRSATIASFYRLGLPYGVRADLITKPGMGIDDTTYKVESMKVVESLGEPVLFIDNEPSNCNAFFDRYPQSLTVFFKSDHSDRPDRPYAHLPVLESFWRTHWPKCHSE